MDIIPLECQTKQVWPLLKDDARNSKNTYSDHGRCSKAGMQCTLAASGFAIGHHHGRAHEAPQEADPKTAPPGGMGRPSDAPALRWRPRGGAAAGTMGEQGARGRIGRAHRPRARTGSSPTWPPMKSENPGTKPNRIRIGPPLCSARALARLGIAPTLGEPGAAFCLPNCPVISASWMRPSSPSSLVILRVPARSRPLQRLERLALAWIFHSRSAGDVKINPLKV